MAWRMVMRRCPLKSMTVVGDVAQTSDPAGATNWERALRAHARDRWRMEELTVNYRTPEEIMTVAEPVLAAIDPALKIPESVRHSGFRPWVRSVSTADLSAEVAGAVLEELAGHAQGQVAVLVPEDADAVRSAVATAVPGTSNDAGPGHRVAVLTVREAKGLEFDAVILVEPRRILQNGAHGTGDLYVALTRATQRLGVVHAEPLPAVLSRLVMHDEGGPAGGSEHAVAAAGPVGSAGRGAAVVSTAVGVAGRPGDEPMALFDIPSGPRS
jgi:DNA helicase IV